MNQDDLFSDSTEDRGCRLEKLAHLFLRLCTNSAFVEAYPLCAGHARSLESAVNGGVLETVEAEATQFYCQLHSADVGYTEAELGQLHGKGGYWCYAGGLEPLFRAGPFITDSSRSVDLGAGNGLQGMLLQYLYPHEKTVQVELSRAMIERGSRLRAWMGLDAERFDWIHGDIADLPLTGFDFIYMYLPVRPEGKGAVFYGSLAEKLEGLEHPVIVFSVADCFRAYAPVTFRVIYSDGHLTCFSNRPPAARGDHSP